MPSTHQRFELLAQDMDLALQRLVFNSSFLIYMGVCVGNACLVTDWFSQINTTEYLGRAELD